MNIGIILNGLNASKGLITQYTNIYNKQNMLREGKKRQIMDKGGVVLKGG